MEQRMKNFQNKKFMCSLVWMTPNLCLFVSTKKQKQSNFNEILVFIHNKDALTKQFSLAFSYYRC